jgi:hypothetical protein
MPDDILSFSAGAHAGSYNPSATHFRNVEYGQSAGCATKPCFTGLRHEGFQFREPVQTAVCQVYREKVGSPWNAVAAVFEHFRNISTYLRCRNSLFLKSIGVTYARQEYRRGESATKDGGMRCAFPPYACSTLMRNMMCEEAIFLWSANHLGDTKLDIV